MGGGMDLERVVSRLAHQVERRFYGKYRGLVVDVEDPEKLGRIKVQVPSVLGSQVSTGWAMPCVPYGGLANRGFLFVPEVGAGVWVEFEEGDLEFPVWVGTFWSKPGGEPDVPKINGPDGAEGEVQSPPTRKIIKTAKGHTLQFEDKDGEERIVLWEATHKHVVSLDEVGVAVTDGFGNSIKTTEDGISIADAHGNSSVTTADGIVVKDANGNTVETTSDGIAVTDASGNTVKMTADGIALTDATGNAVQMTSSAFTLLAKVPFTLDASGQPIVLKGSTIDLNKA
jgi:uncharacterized protein involved in type VI secretion and phage assembly